MERAVAIQTAFGVRFASHQMRIRGQWYLAGLRGACLGVFQLNLPLTALYAGLFFCEAGALEAAVERLEGALLRYRELGSDFFVRWCLVWKGTALAGREDGRDLLLPYLTDDSASLRGWVQLRLATLHLSAQDFAAVERCLPPTFQPACRLNWRLE
jgi:hypothetical protein